jgi:DNA-directed RNA polymerase subunit RPC12/RpoP
LQENTMISAHDVPACPACGSREVHPVQGRDDRTLYACRQCGRDNTDAWRNVQPPKDPKPVIGSPGHENEDIDEIGQSNQLAQDPETIREAAMRLGICAELKR